MYEVRENPGHLALVFRITHQPEKGPRGHPQIRSKMGSIRSKIGGKKKKRVLSFMKIPLALVSPSLDQKEQNYFGHPQFYISIAPM